MKLSIEDRLIIGSILPQKADYATLIQLKDIREKVGLKADEAESIGFEAKEGGFTWDKEKAKDIDVELNARQTLMISDKLEELNEKEELTEAHIPTYEKFCA